MEKEVVWTQQAQNDLNVIYEFYCSFIEEHKALTIIETILDKADVIYQPIIGGTKYISSINRGILYEKLVIGNFIIIYREESNRYT